MLQELDRNGLVFQAGAPEEQCLSESGHLVTAKEHLYLCVLDHGLLGQAHCSSAIACTVTQISTLDLRSIVLF